MVDGVGRSAKWLRKRVREEDTAGERERERERERCIEEREKFNKIKRKCFSISINTVPIVELYYRKIYLVFKTFDIGVFLVC